MKSAFAYFLHDPSSHRVKTKKRFIFTLKKVTFFSDLKLIGMLHLTSGITLSVSSTSSNCFIIFLLNVYTQFLSSQSEGACKSKSTISFCHPCEIQLKKCY